jgi:hypothetical protein
MPPSKPAKEASKATAKDRRVVEEYLGAWRRLDDLYVLATKIADEKEKEARLAWSNGPRPTPTLDELHDAEILLHVLVGKLVGAVREGRRGRPDPDAIYDAVKEEWHQQRLRREVPAVVAWFLEYKRADDPAGDVTLFERLQKSVSIVWPAVSFDFRVELPELRKHVTKAVAVLDANGPKPAADELLGRLCGWSGRAMRNAWSVRLPMRKIPRPLRRATQGSS